MQILFDYDLWRVYRVSMGILCPCTKPFFSYRCLGFVFLCFRDFFILVYYNHYEFYKQKFPDATILKTNVKYCLNYEGKHAIYMVDYVEYTLNHEQILWLMDTAETYYPSGTFSLGYLYQDITWYVSKENGYYSFKKDENGNFFYNATITTIPPDPTREGYTFGGWYKEPECINKWDFDTDTLPELILDENNNIVFQETALYAKWI